MSRLQVRELCFAYAERQVFTDWSAQFDGGLAWLRGGNGSGKSTLLKLLAGAIPPGSGEVRANGLHVSQDAMAYRREVFWCGPGPVPFDHLSPTEYFAFLRGLYPSWNDAALPPHIVASRSRRICACPCASCPPARSAKCGSRRPLP